MRNNNQITLHLGTKEPYETPPRPGRAYIQSVPHVGRLIISSNASLMVFYEIGEREEKPAAVAVCVSDYNV